MIIIIIPALLVAATITGEKCRKRLSEHRPCVMNSILTITSWQLKEENSHLLMIKEKRELRNSDYFSGMFICFSTSSRVPRSTGTNLQAFCGYYGQIPYRDRVLQKAWLKALLTRRTADRGGIRTRAEIKETVLT